MIRGGGREIWATNCAKSSALAWFNKTSGTVFDTFYLGPRAKQRKWAPGPEEAAVSSEQPAPNKKEQLKGTVERKGRGGPRCPKVCLVAESPDPETRATARGGFTPQGGQWVTRQRRSVRPERGRAGKLSLAVCTSRCVALGSGPQPPRQHQGLFQWVNSSHEVAKVLEFQL